MNLFALLSVVTSVDGEIDMPDLTFLEKIWASLSSWFIDERGWLKMIVAIAIVLIGLLAVKIVLNITNKIVNKSKLKGIAGDFLMTILKVILIFIYVICILHVLGIDTSSFVALFTVGTLAISLAVQSVISNFASGIVLVSNHPFNEGDYVEIAGVSGTVVKITLFSTKIKTPDNKVISVPNTSVAEGNIVNYSAEDKRRVDLTFRVAYGSDIDRVKLVIEKVLDEHTLVLHDEGYTVRLYEQTDSALIFVCRCWVKNSDYWTVYFDLNENMTKQFAQEEIEIPYSKVDVNIVSQKAEH